MFVALIQMSIEKLFLHQEMPRPDDAEQLEGPCPPKAFLKDGALRELLSTRLCAPLKDARSVFRLRH